MEEAAEEVPLLSTVEFRWNRRSCRGNALHLAALDGDVQRVVQLLREDTTHRLYETQFLYQLVPAQAVGSVKSL